jgi:hypothetical protein
MDYQALNTELTAGHPDTGAYSLDAATAEIEINLVNRTANKGSLLGDLIFAATDGAEFAGLTDHKQQLWVSFTSKDSINAFEQTNIDFLDHIFGPASITKATLATLRIEPASRAVEIGLGYATAGDIQIARTP